MAYAWGSETLGDTVRRERGREEEGRGSVKEGRREGKCEGGREGRCGRRKEERQLTYMYMYTTSQHSSRTFLSQEIKGGGRR